MPCESFLVNKLFQQFEHDGIAYVIVGDTRRFPQEIHGDTDIVTDSQSLSLIKSSLSQFCHNHNIQIVQILQHEQSAWYYVLAWFNEAGQLNWFNPDICSDYFRFGQLFLKADELLSDRIPKNNLKEDSPRIYTPAPSRGFIYYLLKKIDKGELNHRQEEYLNSVWDKEPTESEKQIKRFWPKEDRTLLTSAAEKNEWAKVQAELPRLQKTLNETLSFSFRNWWFELARKVKRVIKPTGVLVVFLGSDGSGKSTVLAQVEHDLTPAFRRTRQYHLRPFFGQPCAKTAPTKNPHDQEFRGLLSSFMKLFLWWADFTVGYAIEVFPRLACSTFVLFDRYYYDLLIDPKRYRYGGPRWLAWLIGKCIPRPDVVIFLDAPAEVLMARKQEISLAELTSQRIAYRKLLRKMENGHVVDASRPLAEVRTEVARIILNFMEARTLHRLGVREKTP